MLEPYSDFQCDKREIETISWVLRLFFHTLAIYWQQRIILILCWYCLGARNFPLSNRCSGFGPLHCAYEKISSELRWNHKQSKVDQLLRIVLRCDYARNWHAWFNLIFGANKSPKRILFWCLHCDNVMFGWGAVTSLAQRRHIAIAN